MQIEILRLNHRIARDKRVSTHVALTARAFHASKLYYTGQQDREMEESINKVTKRFGGNFEIIYTDNDKKLIESKKKENYIIVHLTVYGLPIQDKIKNIRKLKNVLVIIGGKKVEPQIYNLSDINMSIGNQPHSEVSSLAIFLHEYFEGKELISEFKNYKVKIIGIKNNFKNAKVKIIQSERGKLLKQL